MGTELAVPDSSSLLVDLAVRDYLDVATAALDAHAVVLTNSDV
jgi:hypothetical protein